jgi:sorbitol-specific phosphotransferase system component IIBC
VHRVLPFARPFARPFVGPSSLIVLVALGAAVGLESGCGRTAEPRFACPALPSDCDALLAVQAEVEGAYAAAANAKDVDTMDEAAACAQLFTDAVIDGACTARCDELCRLHPCNIEVGDGSVAGPAACPARCSALSGDGIVNDAALDVALFKAAENPGFCTCRACTAPDDALCTALFNCALP